MATITLTFSAEHKTRLVNSKCIEYDYDNNKLPGETKGQFTLRMLIKRLKKETLQIEEDTYNTGLNGHLETEEDDYKIANPEPTEIDIT